MIREVSTYHAPRLPNELLIIIFSHLALPYEIEPSDLTHPRLSTLASREIEDAHRSMMRGMRNDWGLVYVCKSWYTLLAPIMFEWITIYRQEYLEGLLDVLRRPPGLDMLAGSRCAGSYTRRFDIAFRQCEVPPAIVGHILEGIFEQLPHLEILIINMAFDDLELNGRILHAMSRTVSSKLKVITWYNDWAHIPEEENWRSFINSHPNLFAINPPYQFQNWRSSDDFFVIAPSVEHICIHGGSENCHRHLDGTFPSLKRLTIKQPLPWVSPNVIDFLLQHKATLTTIQLDLYQLDDVDCALEFEPLFNASPNLHRVDLVIFELVECEDPRSWQFSSSITEIGVRVVQKELPSEQAMLQFFAWLTYISRGKREEAATIHFLDDFDVQYVLVHCQALIDNRGAIVTSFKRRSGEVIDLLSLDNVEELSRRAALEVKEKVAWCSTRLQM